MRAPGADAFRSLRVPNYRLWAAGALVSNIGTWMQRVGQNWLVFAELTHHSAAAVGVTMALQFGPQLLFLPATGWAADHLNQRRMLMATQAALGALALALGVAVVAGLARLWHVYVFAFLYGAVAAFDAPVRQIFVAELVADEDLPNAVALNSTSFNAARMVGPAIAGLTIAAIGTGWAFVINGLSFGAVLISLVSLRAGDLRPIARAPRGGRGVGAGFRYALSRPDLLAILAMLLLVGTFGLNFQIFTSTMAVRVFHADARGFGLLSSVMAVGALAGALIAAGRRRVGFASLLVGAAVFGAGCALAAIAPGYWPFAAALVVIGVAALTLLNASNSVMQLTTEPSMRGRIMALRLAVLLGGTPIGAPIVGWVADRWGPRWALGVGAASGFAAAAVAAGYIAWRRRPPVGEGAEAR